MGAETQDAKIRKSGRSEPRGPGVRHGLARRTNFLR